MKIEIFKHLIKIFKGSYMYVKQQNINQFHYFHLWNFSKN